MINPSSAFVVAALLAAVSAPAIAADAASDAESESRCGVDRVCLTPAAQEAITNQLSYASKQTHLQRTLSLESIRAGIAKQRAAQTISQQQAAGSATPAPMPVAPSEPVAENEVNTDFPAFGGGPDGGFPFPGGTGAGGGTPTQPFEVAGTSHGKAVVRVYGAQRVVSIGDKLPMGKVSAINFNEVVLGNGDGDTRRYSVSW
jgi:hypothetical protein